MSVFAVPKSMARSREKRVCSQSSIEVVFGIPGVGLQRGAADNFRARTAIWFVSPAGCLQDEERSIS
jgi:hypothetical protein